MKQIVPPGILVPRSKFNILDDKFSNFQCKEPVRIRNDPTAGQSNIVVSRSPVQIPESANVFFFLLSLMFSKVKATAFVGTEIDRYFIAFSCTTILVLKKAGANCRERKMVSIKMPC